MPVASPPPWDGPIAADRYLANLGFLANSDLPDRAGPAYLLVGLRARPTLRHFDPEVVQYWVSRDGRGTRRTLVRGTHWPIDERFSWGLIRIVDRLGVSNEFLTFGGRVRGALVGETAIVVFQSPAPILRRGGHSQVLDVCADHLGAFFGRLLLAVDLVPGFERITTEADAVTLYAAFVSDAVRRFEASATVRELQPAACRTMRAEARRLRAEQPGSWRGGEDLAAVIR
ncbi:MAG TPA: hypothetical protein VFK35_09105 [Candidatus Limnocylindrales bacterium]|nr:hypothetical protein [Candidatus Limnocylindrales bacterium]